MAQIALDLKYENQQRTKGIFIKSRDNLAFEREEAKAAALNATSKSRESWTVANDSYSANSADAEPALFYTETPETVKLRSALKKDIYGDGSDDGGGSVRSSRTAASAAAAAFAEPEPRVFGLPGPRRSRAGAPTRALNAARYAARERSNFPLVGDEVTIHHAEKWRRAVITAIKPTRWFRNRPSTYTYDARLVCDGKSWLPEELDNFRRVFDRVDTDRSGFIDVHELQELLLDLKHPLAYDDAAVADLFRRVDTDGSGSMDFSEFIDLVYVELQEMLGLDHAVYGIPETKLKRRPEDFSGPVDVFAIEADPFKSLLKIQSDGRRRRARAHSRARIEALSRPSSMIAKAPPPKRRDVLSSRGEARLALTRNIFNPAYHDLCSVPRVPDPPVDPPPVRIYFHPGYRYAGPAELPENLISPLQWPLGTTSLHRHAYGHSRARAVPFKARSAPDLTRVTAPSSLARPPPDPGAPPILYG